MTDPSQIRVPGDFRDKLTIETPEQTVLEFEMAGIGSRFLALAYDTLLQILIGIGLLVILLLVGVAMPSSSKTGIWFVAFIVLMSGKNKRLGDFVAGTIVVHEKSLADAKPVWQSPVAGQEAPTTTYGSERLTPEEFALIEAFLNRRSSLPGDVRFNMADQIAKQIRPKLSLPPGEVFYAEHLLEAVAHERRSTARYS